MDECFFCAALAGKSSSIYFLEDLDLGPLFVAAWDASPVSPGHALVIPSRHVQYMKELSNSEQQGLVSAVIKLKNYIESADLQKVYHNMNIDAEHRSRPYIDHALESLTKVGNRPPDAFNDGLNDGPAAGQTIPHFHWHVMPRWQGDANDPRGGIRHMFQGLGNYHEGLKK